MEKQTSVDALHGMIIAQGALINSLIRALPSDALQPLLSQLERDTDFGRDYLVGQPLSDQALASFQAEAKVNLNFVQELIQTRQATSTAAGVLHWIRAQQDPNPN